LEAAARALFDLDADFLMRISCGLPARPRLCRPTQYGGAVVKNPLSLFIGVVAAVLTIGSTIEQYAIVSIDAKKSCARNRSRPSIFLGRHHDVHGTQVMELNQRCVVEYVSVYVLKYNGTRSSPPLTAAVAVQYMEEFPMKMLLATIALATLVSSSAHAQYGNRQGYYGAYARVPPYSAYRSYGANRAYAQVPPPAAYYGAYAQAPYFRTPGFYDLYGRPSPYPYSVYSVRGVYIGSDPDPRVRSQLAHDPAQGRE